ncbi:MAG: hypothetical protein JWR21_3787 [Herminiimonas sp.]|nr:hypothetical protein [Herminiimonas sp.]
MKKALTAVSLVSGLLMAGIVSYASAQNQAPQGQAPGQTQSQNQGQNQGPRGGQMQGHHDGRSGEHRGNHDPVAGTQKRLEQLKQKLNLKPAQQASWDTFANATIANARARAVAHEKMEGKGQRDRQSMSTPERMEKMAAMMRANADSLSKAAADTKTFYDGLSVEQRTIFDLTAQKAWKGRMGHGEHGGHGMR